MTEPFLSVIIPTYNRSLLIKEMINHLVQQNYPADKFEIIIIDDGSSDDTPRYLSEQSSSGILCYIRSEHKGSSSARNIGAKKARGQVLVFTDDDCIPQPDWLAEIEKSYKSVSDPLLGGIGGRIENAEDGHWLYPFYSIQGMRHTANHSPDPVYLDTANATYKRTIFQKIGGFDEAISCSYDFDLGCRVRSSGYHLYTNQKAIVIHLGRKSLIGMMREAYQKGRDSAFLIAAYPEIFVDQSKSHLRDTIKKSLEKLKDITWQFPEIIRPLAYAISVGVYRFAHLLPEVEFFFHNHIYHQIHIYRSSNLSLPRQLLYFSLECLDFGSHHIGRLIGVCSRAYKEAKLNQKVVIHDN